MGLRTISRVSLVINNHKNVLEAALTEFLLYYPPQIEDLIRSWTKSFANDENR